MNFEQFLIAIESNDISLVEQFLDNKDFNPAEQDNIAFLGSCIVGNFEIAKLLLNDKRINPATQNNQAFIFACANANGYIKIVELLLNDKRINPADQNNLAFIQACKSEDINIIKLLLNDKRINPSDQANYAFLAACFKGHIKIIKLFIDYNIYTFEFDFKNDHKLYFLKIVYPYLKNDIEKYLIDIEEEELIIELQKSIISDKISTF